MVYTDTIRERVMRNIIEFIYYYYYYMEYKVSRPLLFSLVMLPIYARYMREKNHIFFPRPKIHFQSLKMTLTGSRLYTHNAY